MSYLNKIIDHNIDFKNITFENDSGNGEKKYR